MVKRAAQLRQSRQRLRPATALFAVNVLAQAASFAVAPFLARDLAPTGRGQLALVSVLDDTSSAVFHAGVPAAVGYYGREECWTLDELYAAVRRYGRRAAIVSLPVAAVVSWLILSSLDVPTRLLTFLLLASSPLIATRNVAARQVLLLRGDLTTTKRATVYITAYRVGAVVGLWLFGILTVPTAIVAVAGGAWLITPYLIRRCAFKPAPAAPLGPLLKFGFRSLPGFLASLSNGRLDQLVIAPILGNAALGVYAVALTVNSVIATLGATIGLLVLSRPRHRPVRFMLWPALAASCALGGAVATFVLTGGLVLAFGREYEQAETVALTLLPGSVAYSLLLILQQIGIREGKPGLAASGVAGGLLLSFLFVGIGAQQAGLSGAALGTSLAYVLAVLVTSFCLRATNERTLSGAPREDSP